MRLGINLLLIALIGLLVWVLINSIREPIKFKAEKEKRKTAVVDRLVQIRQAQELYRDVTGGFAPTFDTLKQVLETGEIPTISVFGDPDATDQTEAIRYDTIFVAAVIARAESGTAFHGRCALIFQLRASFCLIRSHFPPGCADRWPVQRYCPAPSCRSWEIPWLGWQRAYDRRRRDVSSTAPPTASG